MGDNRTSIGFKCPTCDAEHTRGFLDGVSLFRCLRCDTGFTATPRLIDRSLQITRLPTRSVDLSAFQRRHSASIR